MKNQILAVIVGPSGSGKTYLANQLILQLQKELPEYSIHKLITCTTRPKRANESENAYHFVDRSYFLVHTFVETNIYDNESYGLSKKELLGDYDIGVIVVDKNGYQSIKNFVLTEPDICLNLIPIYLNTPVDVCVTQMKYRGDSEEQIINRLINSIVNNEFKKKSYYFEDEKDPLSDFIIVNNNDGLAVEYLISKIKNEYFEQKAIIEGVLEWK